jgi:Lrp/AsnC family leucine-responsive transcriptional regulator
MERGRASWAELAPILGLSAPAAADRVRRLEERGVIQGYAALIDPEAVGLMLTAFVAVTLERPEHRDAFLAWANAMAAVQECHHVTGDHDYLLKVRCASTRALEALLTDGIKGLTGIAATRTTIVLRTRKETPILPLPEGEGDTR